MLYAVDVLEQKLLPEKPETSRRIHEDQRIVPTEQSLADPEVLRRQLRPKDSSYRVLCPHRAQSLPPALPEPAAVPWAELDILLHRRKGIDARLIFPQSLQRYFGKLCCLSRITTA